MTIMAMIESDPCAWSELREHDRKAAKLQYWLDLDDGDYDRLIGICSDHPEAIHWHLQQAVTAIAAGRTDHLHSIGNDLLHSLLTVMLERTSESETAEAWNEIAAPYLQQVSEARRDEAEISRLNALEVA